ncbi:two-component sensor histidine kinase [Pontibacter aydingkolensis]|uniref:Histidine kinase n=1 Tax=Pontibacter aydingkolensis TaxID=1911536 RepID=A0ABS7CQ71_9BACT|nr:histidine kinase [Pontibacter aydingkolensis]MBW7465986.1 histidine kinase [Pontibacter aydingkolensis]
MFPLRIILAYIGWALLWTIVQATLLWSMGLQESIAVTDALLTNILLVTGGYAVGTGLRYYQPGIKEGAYLFGWSLGLAGICILLFDFFISRLFKGETDYLAFVDATLPVRMVFAWLMVLLLLLLSWMWFYTLSRRQEEERKAATEKLAREAELYNLRQQLQPHFLFNSLNSISALVGTRPEQARTMIHQLSDFLRGTLRKEDQQLVTLEDELKHLELYLEIEKVRFGHRLQTAIQVQNETMNMQLPALLLQPLVENAIKFGLYDTIGDTAISIKATAADHYLQLQVQNPYDSATTRPKRGTGFGLSSVQRRLYLLYARQDLLTTQQQDHTFTTTIKIPQKL